MNDTNHVHTDAERAAQKTNCPICLQRELSEANAKVARAFARWKSMDSAPKDGTTIEGLYPDDGTALIRWSNRPVCMLGSRNGGHPPGWATTGGETDENLPMDPPIAWREPS